MGTFPRFIVLTIVSSALLTATATGRKVEQPIGGVGQLRPPPPVAVNQAVGGRNQGGRARFGAEDRVAPWIVPNGELHRRPGQPLLRAAPPTAAPHRPSIRSFFDNEEPVPTQAPAGPKMHHNLRNNPAPPPRGPFIPSIRLEPLVPEPKKVGAPTVAPLPAAEQRDFYDPYRPGRPQKQQPLQQRPQAEPQKSNFEEYDYYDPEDDFRRKPTQDPSQEDEELAFFQSGRIPTEPVANQKPNEEVAQQRPFQDDDAEQEQPLFRPESPSKKPTESTPEGISFFKVEGREEPEEPETRQFPEEEESFVRIPDEEPRFDEQEEGRFDEQEKSRFGPEQSQFGRPEAPKFGRPDEEFGRPEEPKFGRPEEPKFGRPDEEFDRPEEPKFGRPDEDFNRPEEPKFGRPEQPKFGRPDEFGSPEGPKFGRPEEPKFGRPEEPKFGRPEAPEFGRPEEEPNFDNFEVQKERPKFERPQNFGPPQSDDFPPPEAGRPNFNRPRPNKNRNPHEGPFGRPQEDERPHFNRNRPKNRPPTREPIEDGQQDNPFNGRPEEPHHDERRPNRNRVRGNKNPQPVREPEQESFGGFGGFGAPQEDERPHREPERPARPGRRPANREPFSPFNDQHEPNNEGDRPPNFRKPPPARPNNRPQNLRDQEEGLRNPEDAPEAPERPNRPRRPQNRPNAPEVDERPPRGRPQFFPKIQPHQPNPQQHQPNQQQQTDEDDEILGLTPFAKPKLPPGGRPANRRPPPPNGKVNGRPVPAEEGRGEEEAEFQRPEGPRGPQRQPPQEINHPPQRPRPVLDIQGAINTVKTYMGIPVPPPGNRVRPQGARPEGQQRRPEGGRQPVKNGEREPFRGNAEEQDFDDAEGFRPGYDQFNFQRSVDDKLAEEGPEHRDLTEIDGPEHRGLPDSDDDLIDVQMIERPTSAAPVVQQEYPTVAPELTAPTTPESASTSTLFPPFNKRVRPNFGGSAPSAPSNEQKLNPPRITSYKQRIEAMREKAKQQTETIRDKQDDASVITLVDSVKAAAPVTTEATPKETSPKSKIPPRFPVRKRIDKKPVEPEVMEMVPSEEKPAKAVAPHTRAPLPVNPYARRRNQVRAESDASGEPELLAPTTPKWQPTAKFTRRTSSVSAEPTKVQKAEESVIPPAKKPNPFVNRFRNTLKEKVAAEEVPIDIPAPEESGEFGSKKVDEEEPRVEFIGVVPPPPVSKDAVSRQSDEEAIVAEELPVETHLVRPETRSNDVKSEWINSFFTMATSDPILPIEALLTLSPRDNGKGQ